MEAANDTQTVWVNTACRKEKVTITTDTVISQHI